MKNKIELFSIAILSVSLTAFGFYVDGDENDLSALNNMKEFTLMLILVFTVLSTIYFSTKFIFKKLKQLVA